MRASAQTRLAPKWKLLGMSMLDVGDARRGAAVVAQVGGEGIKRLRIPTRRGKQQPPRIGIVEQGHVVLATSGAGLIHADPGDPGICLPSLALGRRGA